MDPTQANEAEFLRFHQHDDVPGNFIKNFLVQYNAPKHLGLYKVLASNIEEGVNSLRGLLFDRNKPENKVKLDEMRVDLNAQKMRQDKKTAIDPAEINWEQLAVLGLSKVQIEKAGELDKLLNYQKTNLLPICIPAGDTHIDTKARLALRTDSESKFYVSVHALRKEPQLDYPFMGYKFSEEDKTLLPHSGNLGKVVWSLPHVWVSPSKRLSPSTHRPTRCLHSVLISSVYHQR